VSEDYLRRLVGSEILVNKLEYFEIILENVVKIKIKREIVSMKIFIPSSENYVFHKLLTFPLRPDQILRIWLLKPVVLLAGSGSAVSEARLTVFERDPSVEGSTLPVMLIVRLSPAAILLKVH